MASLRPSGSARSLGLCRRLARMVVAAGLAVTACTAPGDRPAPPAEATSGAAAATTAAPAGPAGVGAPAAGPPLRDHLRFGAYVPDLPWGRRDLPALEDRLGAHLEIASSFVDWTYVFGGENDRWQSASGTRRVVYSWDPNGIRFASVAAGEHDAYLGRIADSMARYPYEIVVRPWAEMNGDWATWHPTASGDRRDGGTPAEFVAAWRHVVGFFRSRGVTNLRFMFNPDAGDGPDATPVATVWPGAEYVDLLGIDGYNWGDDARDGLAWQEFEDIFAPMYDTVTALHPTAEVWLPEMGCKEPAAADGAPVDAGHSKARWIAAMMASTRFPRITAAAWFNVRKERDWRLESSPGSLAAMRSELVARLPR